MSGPVAAPEPTHAIPQQSPLERIKPYAPSLLGLPAVILFLVVLGGVTTSGFLTADNIKATLLSASIVGIAAVGMTMITLSGNFFSLGTQQSVILGAVVFTSLVGHGMNVVPAIVIVLAMMLVLGVGQGLVVSAGLNPVITTLATGAVVFGVLAKITLGETVGFQGHVQSWLTSQPLGIPVQIFIFAGVTVAAGILVSKTVVGRHIVLLGANREAAEMSGISFRWTTIWAFVIFSLAIAIASILSAAQLGQANVNILGTLTIECVAAVLVGGTAIQGGYGSPARTAGGAIIIAMLTDLMVLRHFSIGGRQTAVGAVALIVVVVLELIRRRQENT